MTKNNSKNGCSDYLIEEEEGLNDHNVVIKCAEIQSAISEVLLHFATGVTSFLFTEYQYFGIFMVALVVLIFLFRHKVDEVMASGLVENVAIAPQCST